MSEKHKKLALFLSMLKIGAFTFGGGYAMIALIRNEAVDKKEWISSDEFYNMVAIAESTPGPIAINSATYIGYRVGGIPGALAATAGIALPSFLILFLISLFFDAFLSLTLVGYAFRGIQVCVAYLILSAGVRMIRELEKKFFPCLLLCLTVAAMLFCTLFAVSFSSIFYLLIGGTLGLCLWAIRRAGKRGGKDE